MSGINDPVKAMEVWKGMSVNDLVLQMKKSGSLSSGSLAKATDIYEQMIRDGAYIFLTLSGALVPAGLQKVIIKVIENGWVNAIVTTGANLVHDVLEAYGGHHHKGILDAKDDKLFESGIDRIYDVFVFEKEFQTKFDDSMRNIYEEITKSRQGETLSINEFLTEIAKRLPDTKPSILKTAYKNNVKIFAPAIQDSVYGLLMQEFNMKHETAPLKVDAFTDLNIMREVRNEFENVGAVILGGGVPKNYVFQSFYLSKRNLKYGIQITLDRPETGGLSGATLDEAVSWGKIDKDAKRVVVVSEISLAFPIIIASLLERLG